MRPGHQEHPRRTERTQVAARRPGRDPEARGSCRQHATSSPAGREHHRFAHRRRLRLPRSRRVGPRPTAGSLAATAPTMSRPANQPSARRWNRAQRRWQLHPGDKWTESNQHPRTLDPPRGGVRRQHCSPAADLSRSPERLADPHAVNADSAMAPDGGHHHSCPTGAQPIDAGALPAPGERDRAAAPLPRLFEGNQAKHGRDQNLFKITLIRG